MDSMRAVPGADLSGDPGHEGSAQPMTALRGGMASAYEQAAMVTENSGPVRGDLSNATDKDSPYAGLNFSGSGTTWLGD